MSGHSKWSQIKRQKGVADTRRGQVFTKLSREITLAASQGGANPETNFRLRLAVEKAKYNRMPSENIERAIHRAAGGQEGAKLEEMVMEGYGPGGVAIMVEAVTDNRNRTVQDIRTTFVRSGGNLATSGAVSYLFEPRGVIIIDIPAGGQAEEIGLKAIDAGAEDVKMEKTFVEIHTRPEKLEDVRRQLEALKVAIASADLIQLPKSVVRLADKDAFATIRLMDRLEEMAEVQHLYSNTDYSDEVLEAYKQGLESTK